MMETHVRNAELRKLLDKQDRKFQVILSATFMSSGFLPAEAFQHGVSLDIRMRKDMLMRSSIFGLTSIRDAFFEESRTGPILTEPQLGILTRL